MRQFDFLSVGLAALQIAGKEPLDTKSPHGSLSARQPPSDQSRGWARPADSCATRASHAPSIADLSRVRRVVRSDGSGRLLVLFCRFSCLARGVACNCARLNDPRVRVDENERSNRQCGAKKECVNIEFRTSVHQVPKRLRRNMRAKRRAIA